MPKYKPITARKYDHRKHIISFKNALNGIRLAVDTQPNLRIHFGVLFIVLLMAIFFRISAVEYLIIILVSGMVIALELANTAVEAIGDELAGTKYNKLVGVAKDVAAGAVLVMAITAVIIGIVIFLPRIMLMLGLI